MAHIPIPATVGEAGSGQAPWLTRGPRNRAAVPLTPRAPAWKVTIMNTRPLALAASLALLVGCGEMSQTTTGPATNQAPSSSLAASAVGRWPHDPQGNTIGSVRRLTDGGRTAVIMVGSYFEFGSHEARVPARALSIVDGKATLRAETVQALNAPSGWR